jgi:hypothetical protein
MEILDKKIANILLHLYMEDPIIDANDWESFIEELGLTNQISNPILKYTELGIIDNHKWMLARIKYGI